MLINSRGARGKCPICGADRCSCGGPSKVIPVDQRVTQATGGGKVSNKKRTPAENK